MNMLSKSINIDWYKIVNKTYLLGNILSPITDTGYLSYTSRQGSPKGL